MYLQKIHIKNLKRLRDLELDFTNEDGSPRMWTVFIGKNGTAKTSLLQSIALAACGTLQLNTIAQKVASHLRDRRRSRSQVSIDASFEFTSLSLEDRNRHPLLPYPFPTRVGLRSQVEIRPREKSTLRGKAQYINLETGIEINTEEDPLVLARANGSPLWFVTGCGVFRRVPEAGQPSPVLANSAVTRLLPLFDNAVSLTSTGFMTHFGRSNKARAFARILRDTIIETGILPEDIIHLELRGSGGVGRPEDLLERDRFSQRMGTQNVKIPAVALAHGHLSTIAWIADVIGHILLEADAELEPGEMEGLVLIDELDLYLHPTWQAKLIPALRRVFPNLQFVATTHSPAVLATLESHEIVRLEVDPDGNIARFAPDSQTGVIEPVDGPEDVEAQPDPRTMTGSEVYQSYFDIDRLTLNAHGEILREYSALATDPRRNTYQNARLQQLGRELQDLRIGNIPSPVQPEGGEDEP